MGKSWPAIDVRIAPSDLLLALIDDFEPTAVEERDTSVRIFFPTTAARDRALETVAATAPATAVDVADEDWARRSQENLTPITVGRIVVSPPWAARSPEPSALTVIVAPSMGFGTGHHATTRLCLAALQRIDLNGAAGLDVGTGSGVLAIAASRLGAGSSIGIDNDPDAIQSARENLTLNPDARPVEFDVIDLNSRTLPSADVLTANLTGALLVRSAATLLSAVRTGGTLILSGLLAHERNDVVRAFAPAAVVWEREEEGWVGLLMKKP